MKTIDEIKVWLKENLDEERYSHSLGTADCARNLAKKFSWIFGKMLPSSNARSGLVKASILSTNFSTLLKNPS